MAGDILPPAPEASRLEEWADEGVRRAPTGSNVVTFISPDEEYALTVEVDDPIHGYLIRLSLLDDDDETRIGQAVVDDRDLALQVSAEMAAAAEDLAALEEDPYLGPKTIYEEDVAQGIATPPEDSAWEDEEEWNDRLEEAYEKADIPRSTGTLTTKEIDGREYYYLQWREGDSVRSEYIAPVAPAD